MQLFPSPHQQAEEETWRRVVSQIAQQRFHTKTRIPCLVDTRHKSVFYCDSHKAGCSFSRFEDAVAFDFEAVVVEGVCWRPFSCEAKFCDEAKGSNLPAHGWQAGSVEQDLYFGRSSRGAEEEVHALMLSLMIPQLIRGEE